MNKRLGFLAAVWWLALPAAGADAKWTVHEWGTFTSLQDEAGEAIGGINTDDEPVPPFVHRLHSYVLLNPTEVPSIFFQGAPSCHPDVTMRLETPVIYFHPPETQTKIQTASVEVTFHGGWLSEFYPDASLEVPGLENGQFHFGHLLANTESRLRWNNLKIGGDWPVTNTTAHVWTSPRAVQAASVQTTGGESEKFLFYRGVAHLAAPLRISRDQNSGELLFRSQVEEVPVNRPLTIHSIWLVDIQPGGKLAFRSLPPVSLGPNSKKTLLHTPAEFGPGDFRSGNLETFRAALLTALVAEGLYADEAQALLNTWKLSYFESPGLRLFFLVPRAWTDYFLPLEISLPADLNRVMVGRIELVTPGQRSRLQKISRLSTNQIRQDVGQLWTNYYGRLVSAASHPPNERDLAQVNTGQKPLSSFASVPQSYQTYLDLGRFRNALVLDEAKHRPTEGITNFIASYRLQAYLPTEAGPGH